jgi:hypothetical protein
MNEGPGWGPVLAQARVAGTRLCLLGLLLFADACSEPPRRAPFNPEDTILEPSSTESSGRSRARGELVVETAPTGFQSGAIPQRYRFSVFNDQGEYLDSYVNDLMSPVELAPGRYVVVSRVGFLEKRAQVLIQSGRTTYVSLNDLKRGPEAK